MSIIVLSRRLPPRDAQSGSLPWVPCLASDVGTCTYGVAQVLSLLRGNRLVGYPEIG